MQNGLIFNKSILLARWTVLWVEALIGTVINIEQPNMCITSKGRWFSTDASFSSANNTNHLNIITVESGVSHTLYMYNLLIK